MRVAAVAYVERSDGRILCVWNGRYSGWTLPGGCVEESDLSSKAAVCRELLEETGMRAEEVVEVYSDRCRPSEIETEDRASHVSLFWIVSARGLPREVEIGRPVTWFTREEFLRWSPFALFYEEFFKRWPAIRAGSFAVRIST